MRDLAELNIKLDASPDPEGRRRPLAPNRHQAPAQRPTRAEDKAEGSPRQQAVPRRARFQHVDVLARLCVCVCVCGTVLPDGDRARPGPSQSRSSTIGARLDTSHRCHRGRRCVGAECQDMSGATTALWAILCTSTSAKQRRGPSWVSSLSLSRRPPPARGA